VVVLGLGYVGLPVACLFAEAGFPVTGIRRSQEKVDVINRGVCPIEGEEPGLAELLARVVSAKSFRATTDYSVCRDADAILIAVETPVEPDTKKPVRWPNWSNQCWRRPQGSGSTKISSW
jgi:UDP-N-acetyl-D-mannosaminuronic acid dehydrogenase